MRALRFSFLLFVSFAAASAADLKVKVLDPQSAAVAGAQLIARSRSDISLYDALIDSYRVAGLLPA